MTLRQPYSVSKIRKEKGHLQHHHAVSKHFLPISAISSVQYHYPLVETIVCTTNTTIPDHKQNIGKIFYLQVLYPCYIHPHSLAVLYQVSIKVDVCLHALLALVNKVLNTWPECQYIGFRLLAGAKQAVMGVS